MLERIKRVKKYWDLAKKNPKKIDELLNNQELIDKIPDEGDGRGVYLSEGTEKDFEDFQNEQSGLKAWLKRIARLQ